MSRDTNNGALQVLGDLEVEQVGEEVRLRALEISQGPEVGTAEENSLRAEQALRVVHGYDTVDRDLERLGMTVSRLPVEAGVVWRLVLPRGERVEAWEPGNGGLAPPAEIACLLAGVADGKSLVPSPPLSSDPGAMRLREMIEAQRCALLTHDPGVRLGNDPENLHQHRFASRSSAPATPLNCPRPTARPAAVSLLTRRSCRICWESTTTPSSLSSGCAPQPSSTPKQLPRLLQDGSPNANEPVERA